MSSLGSGSVTSGGGATVAVFTSSPVAPAGTVPVSVNTTDAPVASAGPVQMPVPGSYVPTFTVSSTSSSAGVVVSMPVKLSIVVGPWLVTVI